MSDFYLKSRISSFSYDLRENRAIYIETFAEVVTICIFEQFTLKTLRNLV